MIPKDFIIHWEEFVSPAERERSSVPFLESMIRKVAENCNEDAKRLRILDGGAGLGVEAAALLKKGYWIEINEIDNVFLDLALNYIKSSIGKELPLARVHSINWRNFDRHFGHNAFHLIYILGNSLCLLRDANDVEKVLKQFWTSLFPGGALIVDERNFAYIWQEWGHSINPERPADTYQYRRKDIYCGTRVRGYPIRWEKRDSVNRIVFRYDLLKNGSWAKLAEISLYPFRQGELFDLLKQAGFVKIEIYADLQPVEEINNKTLSDADFLTYVAYKRKQRGR